MSEYNVHNYKKSRYLVTIIILVSFIFGIFGYGKITGFSILSYPELVFEVDLNNAKHLEKIQMHHIQFEDDPTFGNVAVYNGSQFGYTYDSLNIDPRNGFGVFVNAYVDDDTDKNHMGLVGTNTENGRRGFRLKYRDFEDSDRLYVQMGGAMDYGTFEDGSCYRKWCNYGFTFKPNGDVTIYLNGNSIKEMKINNKITINDFLNIGNTISINRIALVGKLANIQVYEGVLSKKEIKEITQIPV